MLVMEDKMKHSYAVVFCFLLSLSFSPAQGFAGKEKTLLQIFQSSPQEQLQKTRWDDGSTTVSSPSMRLKTRSSRYEICPLHSPAQELSAPHPQAS